MILSQQPKWLHYNYLWIKLLLDTKRNDTILAVYLLGEKNDTQSKPKSNNKPKPAKSSLQALIKIQELKKKNS